MWVVLCMFVWVVSHICVCVCGIVYLWALSCMCGFIGATLVLSMTTCLSSYTLLYDIHCCTYDSEQDEWSSQFWQAHQHHKVWRKEDEAEEKGKVVEVQLGVWRRLCFLYFFIGYQLSKLCVQYSLFSSITYFLFISHVLPVLLHTYFLFCHVCFT